MQNFRTVWKNIPHRNAVNHVEYAVLRAVFAKGTDKISIAKHLIRKQFKAITNPNKLLNGGLPLGAVSNPRITKWKTRLLGVDAAELLTEEQIALFNTICDQITPAKLTRRYSYFFTRQDIFNEYQLVQTAHAALELGATLTADEVKDLHFTCVGVDDLRALENVERVLESMRLRYITFREPDIGNQKTAIAVEPIEEHKRGLLLNYRLLKFDRPRVDELLDTLVNEQEEILWTETV